MEQRTIFATVRKDESAFTLVEIIVGVVVLGILAAIALNVFNGQQRAAIEATIQADVSHNKSAMAHGEKNRLYKTVDDFIGKAISSPDNETYYTVSASGDKACTHTLHTFGEDDVVSWKLRSEHGQIEPGTCEPYDDEVVISPGEDPVVDAEEEEEPPPSSPGAPPAAPGVGGSGGEEPEEDEEDPTDYLHPPEGGGIYPIYPANGDTVIDVELVVNETGRACFVVTVNTTSDTGVPWAFWADKTVSPFLGNFIPSDGGDGRYVREDRGDHYYFYGTAAMENASKTTSRVYGAGQSFCAQSPSGEPIERPAVSTQMVPIAPPQGDQWYATQRFKISNDSLYHSAWTTEVDLSVLLEHMKLTPGKAKFQVQTAGSMKIEHVEGNRYRVYNEKNGYWAIHKDKSIEILIQGGQ